MADVPAEVLYGKVEGYFTSAGADTVADAGNIPDERPLNGSLVLTPSVTRVKVFGVTPERDMAVEAVTAKVIDGYVVPPDATDATVTGVHVLATSQTNTSPAEITWTVRFLGDLAIFSSISGLTVPAGGVLNLNTALPAMPAPSVVYALVDASTGLNLVENPAREGTFVIGVA